MGPFLRIQAEIRELSALCQQVGVAGEQAVGAGAGEQDDLPDLGVGVPKRMVQNYS